MTRGIQPSLFPFRRDLPRAASSSRAAWREREGLCLRIETPSGGVFGWGEASPLPGYSPESLKEATEALEAVVLAPEALQGMLASADPTSVQAHVEHGLSRLASDGLLLPGSARFALETALLDLAGRAHGLPMPALWSADRTLGWEQLRVARLCPDAEEFQPTRGSGASSVLKVKVGRDGAFARELQALRQIRRQDPALELRLDANGAWDREIASEHLRQLSELRIRWIEEPTTPRDSDDLAHWIAVSPVPVALDESLQRLAIKPEDLGRLRPAALILKPHVLGAIRCLEMGRSALKLGIETVVSHLFDGPLAYRSSYALALALDSMRARQRRQPPLGEAQDRDAHPAHGLGRHPGLAAWPEVAEEMSAPPSTWGPGLGLSWEMS